MNKDEQIQYYVSGDYFDGPQANLLDAFNKVDGYNEPYGLLHPEYTSIPHEERVKPKARDPYDAIARGIYGGYETQRRLWSRSWHMSYRRLISIQAKSPRAFCEALQKRLGVELLTVLDFGCGQGRPLSTLLNQPAVDKTSSMGVTLPYWSWYKPSNDRVAYANIAHLGAGQRFSTVFSVRGGLCYHPYNHTPQKWTGSHGLMHAINLTTAPGLIVGYGHDLLPAGPEFMEELERKAIAKRCTPKEDGFYGIEVLRRPSLEEIHEYMQENYPTK